MPACAGGHMCQHLPGDDSRLGMDRATKCRHAMSRLLTILLLLSSAATIAHAQQNARPLFDDAFTSLSLHDIWRRGDNWQLVAPDTPRGRGGANFQENG